MTGVEPGAARPVLLVAGHGSRDAAGAAELAVLLDRVRALAPGLGVEGGFIELAGPPLSAAAARLAAGGARDVVVVPLMLLAAGHAKNDIPALLARARLEHPGVRFRYARDLGIHPDLLALAAERLAAAVPAAQRPATAVLLCGRGSSDPDANADLHKVARLLWEGRSWPLVETCYVGITGPRLPDGLERCRRLGARRIVTLPYFLFTGRLEQRIRTQCAAFAATHPGLDVRVASYLGPDERVARLVLARYHEAVVGDPRMNCDLCIHRVALPGFEASVGAPATPHHHPAEHVHPVRR
jgi:sirohydrochlorin cobaltochelatase